MSSSKKLAYRHLRAVAADFSAGIIEGIGGGSSTGMCDAVCLPLEGYLCAIERIEVRTVHGDFVLPSGSTLEHWWLELPNGEILDPTADQLASHGLPKLPRIYIGPRPQFYPAPAVSR